VERDIGVSVGEHLTQGHARERKSQLTAIPAVADDSALAGKEKNVGRKTVPSGIRTANRRALA
jgi:hypothetical protein